MAVNTFTLLQLEAHLSEALGDYLEFDTTTNIGAGVTIVSTALTSYDGGEDDHFNDWWAYITEGNNIGVLRQVSDYATSSGTLTVRGANLTAEAGAVTCRLHRYDRAKLKSAIQNAIREIYPSLHLRLEDQTLITGNILPDASFESWSSASALTFYSTSSVTLAQTSTNGLVRNKTYSAKATASAGNGYFYISSDSYPQLLDLQGKTVDFYCWAYPEVANDASIVIYTIKADGTTQTLTSTTANPAAAYTELALESQALNDDLEEIQLRFKITTNAKYVYFDDALLTGVTMHDYLLPENFRDGYVSQVWIQGSSNSDEACYDHNPFSTASPGHLIKSDIVDLGSQRYLHFADALPSKYRLRLIGYKPLESLSADTDTLTLDDQRLPLLIAKARLIFLDVFQQPVSTDDIGRFITSMNLAQRRYQEAFYKHRMSTPGEYR